VLDVDVAKINLEKARAIADKLEKLDCLDHDVVGQLSADLSDLYAGAVRYQRLLDALLDTPLEDRDRLGDMLADLHGEMEHLRYHLRGSVELVDDLSADFG
jgi:flagellin-specific chaperone FliS